ncbi:hypothetical protein Pedsa_3290 [Pseudopedobacter saltans DSM 12145]|uniref:Fumarate hydratase n=1 Tax=Pseudopedobacter saltans (strain ATCC 51119 / DSM 12145 / JCM 21818 / CCUG 39354 / LMG 10337 / NBRC 100064 / NCIMB 13643) TaxID=762903 RepID=F0SBY4_PSESL|nr:hypothetical protein [Pseudopedobacter saltans]ADY53825.1 hypothetical protein Pedsa_3290 [Pseudopedobacter saltans DSM 12145]
MQKSILVFITSLVICSCTLNPSVQNLGDEDLQGFWAEDSVPLQDKLVSYEKYYLKFTCDSFYLNIKNYSKVNLNGGDCYNKNEWQEYVKGTYEVNKDTLHLNGAFVSSTYRFKPQGDCYRFGNFKEEFILKKISADSLELYNTITSISHIIELKEKLSCNKTQNLKK